MWTSRASPWRPAWASGIRLYVVLFLVGLAGHRGHLPRMKWSEESQQVSATSSEPQNWFYMAADINRNGVVNGQDTTLFRQLLGSPPGPSARVP